MSNRPLHVGIVACSAEGAALCYRTICREAGERWGLHAHPEVTLHSHSLADYVACLERGDLQGVAALMLSSARKLAAAGADFLACPDNTIHAALPLVEPHSPLPWLHIAEVVGRSARQRGFRRVGLSGTRWLVDSEVYPRQLARYGIECMRPAPADRDAMDAIIMRELVPGIVRPLSIGVFQGVFQQMREAGCDAVVLGCTEIPLLMNDANSPLPTLDSTRLLARAALARAAGDNA